MPTIQVTSPLSQYDCEPDLWDVDSDSEKEVTSVPISDTISDSNCTSPKHSVVISESTTPLSGADDEMSDEESVKAQNRRKAASY
ncbi:hypothetical protein QYM36_019983 [Artemia franciscana]|uniref:Uncharacterized protein n=1 Tax=Artemia franciscana TaxID=6661 RepID=A0AA88H9F9_ARTSF|nr:hypothetical protein QYM36_019983 [Artemia franciscana]